MYYWNFQFGNVISRDVQYFLFILSIFCLDFSIIPSLLHKTRSIHAHETHMKPTKHACKFHFVHDRKIEVVYYI